MKGKLELNRWASLADTSTRRGRDALMKKLWFSWRRWPTMQAPVHPLGTVPTTERGRSGQKAIEKAQPHSQGDLK